MPYLVLAAVYLDLNIHKKQVLLHTKQHRLEFALEKLEVDIQIEDHHLQ
jgi:hypothetical protein